MIKSLACVEGGYFGLFVFSFVVRKRYSCVKADTENDGGGCEGRRLCCGLKTEIEEAGGHPGSLLQQNVTHALFNHTDLVLQHFQVGHP